MTIKVSVCGLLYPHSFFIPCWKTSISLALFISPSFFSGTRTGSHFSFSEKPNIIVTDKINIILIIPQNNTIEQKLTTVVGIKI